MKTLAKYKNGNYNVVLYEDGTKIRYNDLDNLTPEFPESVDLCISMRCNGGCQYCFTEDVEIDTVNGPQKIKDLQLNDLVQSVNIETDKIEYKPIIHVFERFYSGSLLKLDFENGNSILCTPNHKIYTKNRGYVMAKDLTKDDEFVECWDKHRVQES